MTLPGIEEFLTQYESAETRRAYKRDVIRFFLFRKKQPKDIGRLDALAWLNKIREKYTPTTVNRMFASIRSYFLFLYSAEMIPSNPFEKKYKLPKIQRKLKEELQDIDVIKIFRRIKNTVRGARDRAIINLMLYNGLRREEVAGLNIGDLIQAPEGVAIEVRGKGEKTRTILLHQEAYNSIIKYLKKTERLDSRKSEPVFLTKSGRRITGETVYEILSKYVKEAGIKNKIHPHMFRAKFASMMLEAGVPITTVQYLLGHSSIETTSMYDHAKGALRRSGVNNIKPIEDRGRGHGKRTDGSRRHRT